MTTDREVLDAIARLVDELDPAPATLADRARAALAERTGAAPLRLLSDSAEGEEPGMRGCGGGRRLRFTGLHLRLDHVAGGLQVTGLAVGASLVVARRPGGEVAVEVDEAGWFHLDRVPSGPVRFVLRGAGCEHATRWFVA
ncbi:hypothetical protein [Saccharothrix sp. HUAS TT1]|uniref:hypothetical protein n=1 Tax=unclassified Saccharothrix TaxID=2593673 RepID=UPI00345BD8FC